jgi:cobalt/nickel transport system permease protein
MTSEIYLVDLYANKKNSIIHKSSPILKIIFTFTFLFLLIFSKDYLKIFIYLGIIFSLVFLSKLPFFKLLKWSLYGLIFGLMFALSQLFYSWNLALFTLLKVFSCILLMIWFTTSTGFIELFSFVPFKTLKNMLLLTYRFFFMIVDSFSRRLKIANVRGLNQSKFLVRLKSLSNIIAHELIHTLEKAERVYKLMILRGFDGKISLNKKVKLSLNDLVIFLYLTGVILIWIIL